jgi:hypothetical protein
MVKVFGTWSFHWHCNTLKNEFGFFHRAAECVRTLCKERPRVESDQQTRFRRHCWLPPRRLASLARLSFLPRLASRPASAFSLLHLSVPNTVAALLAPRPRSPSYAPLFLTPLAALLVALRPSPLSFLPRLASRLSLVPRSSPRVHVLPPTPLCSRHRWPLSSLPCVPRPSPSSRALPLVSCSCLASRPASASSLLRLSAPARLHLASLLTPPSPPSSIKKNYTFLPLGTTFDSYS